MLSVRYIATIIISLVLGFVLSSVYNNYQRVQKPEISGDEILWERIILNIDQKNVAEAEKWLTVLRNDYPESQYCANALMSFAKYQRKEKKYPEAEKLYMVVKSNYSQSDQYGQSLLQLSDMYNQLEEYEKTEMFLTPVKAEFDQLAEGGKLYSNLVLSQFLQKKYIDAVTTIDNFSQRLPESSELARMKLLQGSIYATYLKRPVLAKNIFQGLLSDDNIPEEIRAEATIKLHEVIQKYFPPTAYSVPDIFYKWP